MFAQPMLLECDRRASRRARAARLRRSLLLGAAASLATSIVMRRRGYPMGGNVVVRCQQGHLFTTLWIPFASLKSVRLGWWRLQRCPVGQHWSLVRPVRESELTDAERLLAREHKDIRVP